MDLHCAYHQGSGHETDRCTALRHAIQDLIDQGLVHLGQPSVTQNPLPTHTTHAVPPPDGGLHFLDFADSDDHVYMMSWDDMDPEPIELGDIYEMSSMSLGPQVPTPFRLFPETASVHASIVEPPTFTRYSVQTSFVLVPNVEEVRAPHVDISQTPDVQYILRGGRVMRQPPSAAVRPVEDTSASEEVRAEDDEILRQLQSIQARPLATAITLGYAPSDFGPSTQTVRAYDSTRREVMGTLEIELLIGPTTFVTIFQVLRIPTSFNLLLG